MNIIDFKTSGYFSGTILFLGALLAVVGIAVVINNTLLGVVLLVISLVIFTTHYRLKIDFDNKIFYDYLWILGLKNGDKGKFENIEYIFIKRSKVSQTMRLRVASSTIQKEVYDGYLKFSEKDKIHLITKDSKKDLLEKLRMMSTALKVKIIDYSAGEPTEI